jgi:hypothetical protein
MFIWFAINVLIIYWNWTGAIRFGLGLGDLIYFGVSIIAVFIIGIYYIHDCFNNQSEYVSKHDLKLIVICILSLLFIFLKMTILRGTESKWDGKIFFS